jgi:hypothetical protein
MTTNLEKSESKTATYVLGAIAGAFVGIVASYLYQRAVDEERTTTGGEVQKLQVGQLITIGLALLGIVRQITEMGRPSASKRRR